MIIGRVSDLIHRHLWDGDELEAPYWRRAALKVARTVVLLARDLVDGDLTLRAMGLVYTTLLSLVPLLALSFSVLKGFGVQNQLDDALRTALAPLGDEKASQLTHTIIGFVDNMNVGVLGAVGLVFLIYTVVSLMQKIETSFNHVWRVATPRSFGARFATFLSAITVGPLLVFSAVAITGALMNAEIMAGLRSTLVFGAAIDLVARLVPFALVIVAFTFLYAFIPNTRVRLGAALTGGVVSGLLWESLGFAFASYAAGASNYQLIYATFASAIFFMIWLYLNWLILLIGASIAFYAQHPEVVRTGLREVYFNPASAQEYALSVLARIGQRFYAREQPFTLDELAKLHGVPSHVMAVPLSLLVGIGILAETEEDELRYVPKVPFETTEVEEVLEGLESYQPSGSYEPPGLLHEGVAAVREASRSGRSTLLTGMTLKQLSLGTTTENDQHEAAAGA